VFYPPTGSTTYEREMSTPPTLLRSRPIYGPPLPLPCNLMLVIVSDKRCFFFRVFQLFVVSLAYFYRAMLCIARTILSQVVHPSVYLSICLLHAGIQSKRLNVSSNFLTYFSFSVPNGMALGLLQRGSPVTGASNAWGIKKCDF